MSAQQLKLVSLAAEPNRLLEPFSRRTLVGWALFDDCFAEIARLRAVCRAFRREIDERWVADRAFLYELLALRGGAAYGDAALAARAGVPLAEWRRHTRLQLWQYHLLDSWADAWLDRGALPIAGAACLSAAPLTRHAALRASGGDERVAGLLAEIVAIMKRFSAANISREQLAIPQQHFQRLYSQAFDAVSPTGDGSSLYWPVRRLARHYVAALFANNPKMDVPEKEACVAFMRGFISSILSYIERTWVRVQASNANDVPTFRVIFDEALGTALQSQQ